MGYGAGRRVLYLSLNLGFFKIKKSRPPTAKKRDQKGEDGAGEARHTLRLCAYTSGGSEGVAVRVDEVDS